jgi:hypothetical protein
MAAETGTGRGIRRGRGRGTGTGFVFLRDANLMHAADFFRSFKGFRFILHSQYP